MKMTDLLEHRESLKAELAAIDTRKAQLLRKIKALDVLVEDSPGHEQGTHEEQLTNKHSKAERTHYIPKHAVRFSPRISLIGAVEDAALEQHGEFTSSQLLAAVQGKYPEFGLQETKHISSALSDLEKRGILIITKERHGGQPKVYRANATLGRSQE